ncbi:hypothetical protein [Nocardia sp. NPDC049149]|uniref:AMP-binding enzyme n=1 Tax=Nocardia sp. NPDC049149 TaxID=3364315 RepID=UPI003720B3C9
MNLVDRLAEYGRLVAFVLPHAGRDPAEAELRDFLRPRVSRFEQPRDIYLAAEIPRSSTGKSTEKYCATTVQLRIER